ncbi:MAG: FGGY family carbohydrate kinase, partial [Gemmiger sp.]|nr:FGGY family carbohydrate kinase [Gemmiger sp.]
MKRYLIALDEGTTSCRAILFDAQQNIVGLTQREFTQHYPQPGWVEHDPMEIYSCQYGVMTELLARTGIAPAEIAGIGITNQRETTIVWDKATGRPIYNAIVWQCRRTAPLVEELVKTMPAETIRAKTGLLPDAYYSATKLRWLLDTVPGAQEKAEAGALCFGTVDSWLIYKLTGGKVHVTDATNAARTMLYNIHTLSWDAEICAALNIPRAILPEVKSSSEIYGTVNLGGVEV